MAEIYETPDLYDLEHTGTQPDVGFFIRLASRLRPKRTLEIACGNGRVTIPLGRAAKEWGGAVSGLERSQEMLDSGRSKEGADRIDWILGDARTWAAPEPFDLIISPCASLSHLLQLEDQLAAWRMAFANLRSGGRFVVAELMADLPALAESMQSPPRVRVELDTDRGDGEQRLIRYKTTQYQAHQQRAAIRFLYDRFDQSPTAERLVSDYEAHVYFPNELRLLFLCAGFVPGETWGDYTGGPLQHTSRYLIMCGVKP